ncbi:threonine/homoserine/homoserine lactone efflux protein [Sinorhizobium terangae]|uniref:Threonine transporter RhtB n=1 Tax=Sinorhizobium terangae TaxID=110322 RepID=A0A6N7LMW9_SINTE|nr:hypothetical protein [Sinorhizobium terangae]MBB4189863.1 threonine/homoserine/homoserine lactone efflux protein [Sinorhizobium terangae]MQX19097.1 hypothetical protein [Sinorhizobium terangae]
MELASFVIAVLALLMAPGPTNTLMALAGTQKGFLRMVRFVPAELAGYLTTTMPLSWIGSAVFNDWPVAAMTIKVLAAIWVLHLAVKLWASSERGMGHYQVTARRVYLTTVLNPKALIFGLVILHPAVEERFLLHLALFCFCVAAIAIAWGSVGALATRLNARDARFAVAHRIASIWLTIVSVTIFSSAFAS